MKEHADTKLYHNNQNHCESLMHTNGINFVKVACMATMCVEDIELPIVLVIIKFHFKGFQIPINEISCSKEVLILYSYAQGFTD